MTDISVNADDVLLYERVDGVAVLTFNRPKFMNAFSDEVRAAVLAHLREVEQDTSIGCVMFIGAGKAFSAGGDIANMATLQDANDDSVIGGRIAMAADVMQLIQRLPKPVVAAVNGAAAGAGMNLALGCDMRLGSSDALFSEAFVKIGLIPDWGGFQSLTRLVGTGKAMELMMTGERVRAQEAYRLGLLNQLFDGQDFRAQAMEFCARLAAGPARAIGLIKQGVQIGATHSLADVFAFETSHQSKLFLSADAREGMQAFLQKRPARFGE